MRKLEATLLSIATVINHCIIYCHVVNMVSCTCLQSAVTGGWLSDCCPLPTHEARYILYMYGKHTYLVTDVNWWQNTIYFTHSYYIVHTVRQLYLPLTGYSKFYMYILLFWLYYSAHDCFLHFWLDATLHLVVSILLLCVMTIKLNLFLYVYLSVCHLCSWTAPTISHSCFSPCGLLVFEIK